MKKRHMNKIGIDGKKSMMVDESFISFKQMLKIYRLNVRGRIRYYTNNTFINMTVKLIDNDYEKDFLLVYVDISTDNLPRFERILNLILNKIPLDNILIGAVGENLTEELKYYEIPNPEIPVIDLPTYSDHFSDCCGYSLHQFS
jgi:hypothetical protein